MLNLTTIMLGTEDDNRLAKFYEEVLAKKPGWSDGGFHGWEVGKGWLMIGHHDQVKGKNPDPSRIMLNFETDDVKGEFDRIKGLGAEVVAEPYQPSPAPEMWLATFADPDGNYFQLATPYDPNADKDKAKG